MARPLNPVLYGLLKAACGEVRIAKEGEAATGRYLAWAARPGKPFFQYDSSGEYYRVNCPFCSDTRYRLWVHHLWGRPDEQNRRRWWSAICYNEDCLGDPRHLRRFREMTYGRLGRQRISMPIRAGTQTAGPLLTAEWPGDCVPLSQLPETHHAVAYLRRRRFDAAQLSRAFDIRYCRFSDLYPTATGRIIIPIYQKGRMVGWQGRLPDELDWKLARIPKYYNLPNMPKVRMLYGIDSAAELPVGILVEGVTDVWRIGPGGIAPLGHSLSWHQAQMIVRTGWKALVVMLDDERALALVGDRLAEIRHAGVKVVSAPLPVDRDPADLHTQELWEMVAESLAREHVVL